jgi:4-hydroxy-tetrahydrodipicolinate reductase
MSKIKIGVVGAGGRVGKELYQLIASSSKCEATLGLGRRSCGFEYNGAQFGDFEKISLDVIIDFSSPELIEDCVKFCLMKNLPIVSGTTGLSSSQYDLLKKASEKIGVLWSPNMSLGIALFKKCMNAFSSDLDFDIILNEWHHKRKKDSPSGTAIMLSRHLESIIKKNIQPIVSHRAGGIYGVHELHLVSDEEHLTIQHTALNRAVFAKGAIVAAEWLLKKGKGLYTIDDVLGDF